MGQTIPHYLPHNSQLSPWLMLCLNIINILTRRKIIQFLIFYYIGPDPSYGRRTLTGPSGRDTVQAGTFWGVINVLKNNENQPKTMKLP